MNFIIQFLIFVGFFVIGIIISGVETKVEPLYFFVSLITVHLILVVFSKKEPQLANIVSAKIQLWKRRVPNSLKA